MWAGARQFGRAAWTVLRVTGKEYGKDRCALIAAALAFYGFLSLTPLLLVAVGVFTVFGPSSQRLLNLLSEQAVQFAPGMQEEIARQIRGLRGHSVSVASIAFVGFLWSASRVFSTLQTALYAVWHLERRGPVLHLLFNRLRALALVMLAIVLLLVSLGITSAIEAWKADSGVSFRLGPLPPFWESLLWVASFLTTVIMFLTLYAIVPTPRIRFRDIAFGAGVAAVLWEIAKRGFAYYVARFARDNVVYVSLGMPFLLLLWAYWSAAILLLGAELAWTLSHHARGDLSAASSEVKGVPST
jgi:membrane protein